MADATPENIRIAEAIACEKALLGSVMREPELVPLVVQKLEPQDFQLANHQQIYRAILEIHNSPIDIKPEFLPVYEYIRTIDFNYFIELEQAALPGSLEFMVNRIHQAARTREAQRRMMRAIEEMGGSSVDLAKQFDELSNDFINLLRDDTGIISAHDQIIKTIKRLDNPEEGEFVSLGLRHLDDLTGGAQRGESWIIGGRSSMGKSSLAATMALRMALAGNPVAYVPVEGTVHSQMCRMIAIQGSVNLKRLRTGKLEQAEYSRVAHAQGLIAAAPLYFIEEVRWPRIRAHIQTLKLREPNLAAVFLDYIQLIEIGRNFREREQEVAFISKDVKRLAKDLHIVMFPVAQLNRDVEKRQNKRPILSDLRESGAIEQDADVVLFPFRPGYYGEKATFETDAEIIIAKNREGKTGSIEVVFEPEFVRFTDRME